MKIIKRRDFIKYSALASTSVFIPQFLGKLSATERNIPVAASESGRKLIIVQLSGGNDGLNTVIPFRNDLYYKLRPQISVAKEKVIKLDDETGFNPVMGKFREIYETGNMCIINSAGYPNPDRSHFRAMDIWHTADITGNQHDTGWIGRYLDSECEKSERPWTAVELDAVLSIALKGQARKGMTASDPSRLKQNHSDKFLFELARINERMEGNVSSASNTDFLYKTLINAETAADYIHKMSAKYKSPVEYPSTKFGRNLKTIAELILSGLETTVYYVSLSGFDTHADQKRIHETLLKDLSYGLNSFTKEMKMNGRLDEVLVLVFSEFGRRVAQNSSGGTDHGAANNIYLISGALKKPGIYNNQPDLVNLEDGDINFEIDFRRVYSTILNKWLNADDEKILGGRYNYLDLIR
jgi:uncharacterized protein (DUF1501 family)